MPFDAATLYTLLPAVYRIRDAALAEQLPLLTPAEQGELRSLQTTPPLTTEQAQRLHYLETKQQQGPLKALVTILAEQVASLEENLAQLYDDHFIETCAEWVIPYIGDLVGHRELHPNVTQTIGSSRSQVANAIAYRRRKGTAAMLEQLARDVTGQPAAVVEFFQRLTTTQCLNHVRLKPLGTPNLRQVEALTYRQTPFDPLPHSVDVRRVSSRRGQYNIPNIGIFLWRIQSYGLLDSPAHRVDARRYRFHPLGVDAPLYTSPQTETTITQLAGPLNVPQPLSRRVLYDHLSDYYGPGQSLWITINNAPVPLSDIQICNLSNLDPNNPNSLWGYTAPAGKILLDPELGRLAFPTDISPQTRVDVSFHYGFGGDLGGGDYSRVATFPITQAVPTRLPSPNTPAAQPINIPQGSGIWELVDSRRYTVNRLTVDQNAQLELRAIDGKRPLLELTSPLLLEGGDSGEITLDGLMIMSHQLRVPALMAGQPNRLQKLTLRHCTLVPGHSLTPQGTPQTNLPSLVVETVNTTIEIDHCILGSVHLAEGSQVSLKNSILDGLAANNVAYAGLDGVVAGGPATIVESTCIGQVRTRLLTLASNSIFLGSVSAERRQEGGVRFCYVPAGSQVPRRYYCQPQTTDNTLAVSPQFTSLRYGQPGYAQLQTTCDCAIRYGADDQSEMGAFHDRYQAQRETNLQTTLDDYLRFSLEAGIFYAN